MTTPERLRRRQIRNDWYIAVLAVALIAAFLYFQGQAAAQQRCITAFITRDSETGSIRSGLVERESKATRRIILDGTEAESREEFLKVRARYARALKAIDKARADNPVQPFPKGVCD